MNSDMRGRGRGRGRRLRRLTGGVLALLVTAGTVTAVTAAPAVAAAPAPQRATAHTFTSEEGDWVGQGASGAHRPPADAFEVSGSAANLQVMVSGETDTWFINLAAPPGHSALFPGVYKDPGSTRGRVPDVNVSGHSRGCNVTYGSFTINQIESDASGAVTVLDATYVQRCEAADAPALRGAVKYRAYPLSFRYEGEPGDYPSRGQSGTLTGATSLFVLRERENTPDGRVAFEIEGKGEYWSGSVSAPEGESLEAGRTYPADRMGDNGGAGLELGGPGGGCNRSHGEFTIHRMSVDDRGIITAMSLDLTQYCEDSSAALRATLRYYA